MDSSEYHKLLSEARSFKNENDRKEPNKIIRFVSLLGSHLVEDMDVLKKMLNEKKFTVDYFEYKVVNTLVQRRLINIDRRSGPKERIRVDEKVDVNSNLKYLRQFTWRVLKDVNNVLLVQLSQLKGVPCCLPLIFPSILEKKRQILVSGITNNMRIQLSSKPDLLFKTIPELIVENKACKEHILNRADRERSMLAITRSLQDFPLLPEDITIKINAIAAGEKNILSEAEAINLILLSDLNSRYMPMFQTFQNEVSGRATAVSALAGQFAEMTQGISTERLIEVFKEYLLDEDTEDEGLSSPNNTQLFNFLYMKAQRIEEKRIRIGDFSLTRAGMFSLMRSVVTFARCQFDPDLWKRCFFILRREDENTHEYENQETINSLSQILHKNLQVHESASSQSLMEIHLTHNLHRHIDGKRVLLSKAVLSEMEQAVIKSVVVPRFYQPSWEIQRPESIRLFLEMNIRSFKLINSIHTVSRVYGFLIGRRMREAVQKFLKPGLRDLLTRFGRDFFSIFYEMTILETGLPVSRNQFAEWLEFKGYFKNLEEYGFISSTLETNFDAMLNPKVLSETGVSVFPGTYSSTNFEEDYKRSKNEFETFLENLKKNAQDKTAVVERILYGFFNKNYYSFNSSQFRDYIKKSELYNALQGIVMQCCKELAQNIIDLSVNNKIILKVPFDFEPLLLLENMFNVTIENQAYQVHLIAVPVESEKELEGTSNRFSHNLFNALQDTNNPNVTYLISAKTIVREYLQTARDFFKYISLIVLDRQISQSVDKMRQVKSYNPNYIKYGFQNYEKLIVGNIKTINLGKLVQFDASKKAKDMFYNVPASHILQAVVLYKSANQKLRDYRDTIDRILDLLESHAKKKEEDYESITYMKQIQKFKELLSTPVDELSENVLNIIAILAGKIQKTISLGRSKKGVLDAIYYKWNRLYGSRARKIDFYFAFLKEFAGTNYEKKMFIEIAKSREILLNIKRRKCLIFIPDKQKDDHLRYISEIGAFILDRGYDLDMYVEINGLSKENIDELAKVFYPKNFFRLDRINPKKM